MSKKSASFSERKIFPPIPLGDRSSTASNLRGRRAPSSDWRRRKRNPFSERRRINFPDINDVFKSTTASSSGLNDGKNESHDHRESFLDDDEEEGCCPFSDADGSSVLNMSIGARAALNEHARYVAKFGIDGEKNVETENNDNSNSGDDRNSEMCSNVLLDGQWERLLDLSRVASSLGGSISGGIPSPTNSTKTYLHFDNSNTEKNIYEESSSIEVMTDVSCEFFNSSRVNLLITPERNKNRKTEMVMTRDKEAVDDMPLNDKLTISLGSDPDFFCYYNENGDNFIDSSLSQQPGRSDSDLHGSSLNIGDISRISNNTVSDTNRTPDASFQNFHKKDMRSNFGDDKNNDDDSYAFNPFFGACSPSRILDSVPTAAALTQIPSGGNTNQISQSGPSVAVHHHVDKECISTSRTRIVSTDSALRGKSVPSSSSSIKSAVSTFITEARTFARQVFTDVEKSIEGMESLQADFLRGMEIGQTDAPSPISQVLSSPSTSRQGGRRFEKSLNAGINSSSSIDTNAYIQSNSSFASSVVGDTTHKHLTGRKRYRTVVPRRVYLDSPTQHFDEEQDSFIDVQSNPETTRTGVSLLESFEEAATHKTS